jgi:DNA-directed RNA polymerase subunit beta
MAKAAGSTQKQTRVYFTQADDTIDLPNLVDHQNRSFQWMIDEGLGEILAEISPIDDYTGTKLSAEFQRIPLRRP